MLNVCTWGHMRTYYIAGNFTRGNVRQFCWSLSEENLTSKRLVGWKFYQSKFYMCCLSYREVAGGVKTKVKGCCLEYLIMALLYCMQVLPCCRKLLNPAGLLSFLMLLLAIEEANTPVVSARREEATMGTRGPSLKLSNRMTKDWLL